MVFKLCPNCSSMIAQHADFCPICRFGIENEKLAGWRKCSACNQQRPVEDKICKYCADDGSIEKTIISCPKCNNRISANADSCPICRAYFNEPNTISYEQYIGTISMYSKKLIDKDLASSLYFAPDIPEDKLANAINTYAEGVIDDQVIALYDDTLFGSAKEGFIITTAGIYWKDMLFDPLSINFSSISSAKVVHKKKDKVLIVEYQSGHIQEFEPITVKADKLAEFLNAISVLQQKGVKFEGDKIIVLEDMPDSVKLCYLQVIINMLRDQKEDIDHKYLPELQTFMAQLKFTPQLRQAVRLYRLEMPLPTDDLLSLMDRNTPKYSIEALHISLIKDLIRFNRIKDREKDYANSYIKDMANKFRISQAQLDVIIESYDNEERILAGELDDDEIVSTMKDLASKATGVGLPLAAVYMSGSVLGLSAAGITSGLAALGLGGVLGLSSMVTGIGVAITIGIAAYQGLKWLFGAGEREKHNLREFMIQEIIKTNQKAIHNLAEDITYFGDRIVELTRADEINKTLIRKLGQELTLFCRTIDALQSKGLRLEESIVK